MKDTDQIWRRIFPIVSQPLLIASLNCLLHIKSCKVKKKKKHNLREIKLGHNITQFII